MSRRNALIIAALLGLSALAVIGYSNDAWTPLDIAVEVGIAWVYIVAGLVADRRRPTSRVGLLLVGVGAALLAQGLIFTPAPALVSIGLWIGGWWGLAGVLAGALVLTYPTGHPTSATDRAWLALAGVYLLARAASPFVTPYVSFGCAPECRPLVTLTYSAVIYEQVNVWLGNGFVVLYGLLFVLVIRRWITSTSAGRRMRLPVTVAGLVMATAVVIDGVYWRLAGWPADFPYDSLWRSLGVALQTYLPMAEQVSPILRQITVIAFPLALLWGLLRAHLGRAAVGELAVRLRTVDPGHEPEQVREAVRRALGDPSLEIALWSRAQQRWIDELGATVEVPADDVSRAITRLDAPDGPLALLIHDPALNDRPELVSGVTAVAQMALENARLHAEVKAQLEEVRTSRERIVRAADDERRRVERDIHDGAQQRLVSLSLALGMAQSQASTASPALAETLTKADAELRAAINELRELARGIHPAVLTEAGLGPALESLAEHAPLPVTIRADLDGRLPPVVEATAYFVVAEALTNVAKHAGAHTATVVAARTDDTLRLEITDDGGGGADPAGGTGLRGMLDRVSAIGGRLSVDSGTGGTRVSAEIPCA